MRSIYDGVYECFDEKSYWKVLTTNLHLHYDRGVYKMNKSHIVMLVVAKNSNLSFLVRFEVNLDEWNRRLQIQLAEN